VIVVGHGDHDDPERDRNDEIVIPALLRAARGAYQASIRARLEAAGFGDVPRNGAFVLGGMAHHGAPVEALVRDLGGRRPSVMGMLDTLVERGYLDAGGPGGLEVTDRGRAAAAAVRSGIEAVDAELAARLSPEGIAGLRRGLLALIEIREETEEAARGVQPAPPAGSSSKLR